MAVGVDDIESVESPSETVVRLAREKGRSLTSSERLAVYADFYAGKKNKRTQEDVTNTTAPTTTTPTTSNNNVSNLTTPAPISPPVVVPPVVVPPTPTCKLKISGYTWGPKSSSVYGVNVVVDVIVDEQTKPLTQEEFDAGITSRKTETLEFDNQGYITYKGVKYSSLEVCDNFDGTSVAELVKKDKDSNEGMARLYRGWNLDLLLDKPKPTPSVTVQTNLVVQKTTTYEKVEIQPIEIQGLKLTDRVNVRLRSVKMPPIIIESITIPADTTGSVLIDSIELYGPPIIIPEKKLSGTGKTETLESVKLPVITVYVEEIKLKRSDIPIKIRSITFPEATIESLVVPEQLSPDPEIESFTIEDAPFTVSAVRAVEKQEGTPAGFVKNQTIILEDVDIKVDLNDLLKKLQFFQDTDKRPLVDLNLSNRDSTLKVRRILIPEKAEEKHTILTVSTEPIKFGQLEYSTNPNEQKEVLISDKNPEIKLKDVVIDTKKLVEENPKKYDIPEIFRQNLPVITLSEVTLTINASSILLPVSSSNEPVVINNVSFPNNMITTQEVITVPEKKKTVEEQKAAGKADTKQNEASNAGDEKVKPAVKKKGESSSDSTGSKKEKKEDISKVSVPKGVDPINSLVKGREIPQAPGSTKPKTLPASAHVIAPGKQFGRQWDTKLKTYAQWDWTWPTKTIYKPVNPTATAELIKDRDKGNSRPSELTTGWWEYFTDYQRNEPMYGKKGITHPELVAGNPSILLRMGYSLQMAPFIPKKPYVGKFNDNLNGGYLDPVKQYHIWWNPDKRQYEAQDLSRIPDEKSRNSVARYPFFMMGRSFHEGYSPLAYNASWGKLVSTFRLSQKSFGAGEKSSVYGPPLPSDYKFGLLDVGIVMNFTECGYVNRYLLPNGAMPALAASRSEQHLMMVNDKVDKWIEGTVGEHPITGRFLDKAAVNLNWSHEPHWCGISTTFFNTKGNVVLDGGPISVKSYENNVTAKGIPLNRPRLEEGENDPWDESLWKEKCSGKLGVSTRNKWYKAFEKFGAEKCQHPYDSDYISQNKERINQLWFIAGFHYIDQKLTQYGLDLIKTAIKDLDWDHAIVTHTGHVETVLAIDIDGMLYRYGGNTSTDGNGGNHGNSMGIWRTHVGSFGGMTPKDGRGGFCLITRGYAKYKDFRDGPGISSPWKITPVIQTYMDFCELNPDPKFPVYNKYYQQMNEMNTILSSKFL